MERRVLAFQAIGKKWTHTAGQMLVSTKSEILLRSTSGFEGPNTLVNEKPTSRAMYVVAAKNASTKKPNGCRVAYQKSLALALARADGAWAKQSKPLTNSAVIVPSSTSCVLTIALPSSAQKVAATKPACTAVIAVSAVEPCSRKEPVERS